MRGEREAAARLLDVILHFIWRRIKTRPFSEEFRSIAIDTEKQPMA
jgi:hypothetical protein